jgi:LmbE family N-acetylglucosaminyl deacetylase
MREVTVFSPHRDDAAFSLFIALSRLSGLRLIVRVVNFFTISDYAPHVATRDTGEVSAIRKREDYRALRDTCAGIRIIDLDRLDAPVRLGIEAARVFEPEARSFLTDCYVRELARTIQIHARGLTLAPLGLGNHIDHAAVHRAAARAVSAAKLAFYEDLPYARWTSEEQLRSRIEGAQRITGSALRPLVVRDRRRARQKRRVISRYKSQITGEEAAAIAGWSSRFGGGERIWVPQHSRYWNGLRQVI